MGIQSSQKIIRFSLRLAVAGAMASAGASTLAANPPADKDASTEVAPAATATPEPTAKPRPDEINVKKPSASDALMAREWLRLSLLKPDDVPGMKNPPDYADDALRKRITDSFGLPAVMTMRDRERNPPAWWTTESHGMEALNLGPTRYYVRPELKIEAPLLRLKSIPYVAGESDLVRSMNELIRLWTLGRIDKANAIRMRLQADKKTLPRGTLERSAVAILNGFFDLQMAAQSDDPVVAYRAAIGSLWDALGYTETSVFFDAQGENRVDHQLFQASLAEAALFNLGGVYPPKLLPPQLQTRFVDLKTFARTLALASFFNVTSIAVKSKNWTRVYEASQKFHESYKLLEANFKTMPEPDLAFTTPVGVAATHPMLMRPQSAHQLQVIMNILKATAQFIAEDPLLAIRETAKVILNSRVPGFKTIGFSLAGDIYHDLGYHNYARRFYAYAEVFADTHWYQQNPYFLLGGAENAFWQGDYAVARAAFEKFLLAAGDKRFGPWARLRVAEITHLQAGTQKAVQLYEDLLRTQPSHPAGVIARRRLFCIGTSQLGARARHKEYLALKEIFVNLEMGEIEQIRACHISGLVEDASKISTKAVKSLPEEAKLQLEMIAEFRQKFPQSSYLKFFQSRVEALEAAMGPYHLAFKQCREALDFVAKNEKNIATLKNQSGKVLETLKWTDVEHERLLRCAALFSSFEMITKLSQGDQAGKGQTSDAKSKRRQRSGKAKNVYESADQRVRRLTLAMVTAPADKVAANLLGELRRRGKKTLADDVRTLEVQQSQSIDDENFWEKLATLKVLQWDLQKPSKEKPLLNRMMRAEVLRSPEQTIQSEEFCFRLLLESSSMKSREWDAFVLAVPTQRWLQLAKVSPADKGDPADESSCRFKVAAEALRVSQSMPSTARDRHLLWPWLQARGAAKEQEAWLAVGQRWSQQGSVSKQELETLFKTLEKEADIPSVKEAAKAWREAQRPSGLW